MDSSSFLRFPGQTGHFDANRSEFASQNIIVNLSGAGSQRYPGLSETKQDKDTVYVQTLFDPL